MEDCIIISDDEIEIIEHVINFEPFTIDLTKDEPLHQSEAPPTQAESQPKAEKLRSEAKQAPPSARCDLPQPEETRPRAKWAQPQFRDSQPQAKDGPPQSKDFEPQPRARPQTKAASPEPKEAKPQAKEPSPQPSGAKPHAEDGLHQSNVFELPRKDEFRSQASSLEPREDKPKAKVAPPQPKETQPQTKKIHFEVKSTPSETHKVAPDSKTIPDAELMMTLKALGNEKYKHNLFDDAIRIYKRANELAKSLNNKEMSAILHFNLAMTYFRLGSYDQAADECANAVKIDDNYSKAHLKRAEIYQRQGKFDEAVICYEHICELDSTNQDYAILLYHAKEAAKRAKKKDYHQLLGLDYNFTHEDLRKAYRQSALNHHPDRHSDADVVSRRIHEKRFKDVAEAHTFLLPRSGGVRR